MQIDLTAPVTEASVMVVNSSSMPGGSFDLRVQVAAAGGAAGPVASVRKTISTLASFIEMTGVVYGNMIVNPANPSGPGLRINRLAGATVSTSLDSKTTTTDANGAFDLLTDTRNGPNLCFTLTITATGYPTYRTDGWIGSNKETGGVIFTLSPAFPTGPINGRGCN